MAVLVLWFRECVQDNKKIYMIEVNLVLKDYFQEDMDTEQWTKIR